MEKDKQVTVISNERREEGIKLKVRWTRRSHVEMLNKDVWIRGDTLKEKSWHQAVSKDELFQQKWENGMEEREGSKNAPKCHLTGMRGYRECHLKLIAEHWISHYSECDKLNCSNESRLEWNRLIRLDFKKERKLAHINQSDNKRLNLKEWK